MDKTLNALSHLTPFYGKECHAGSFFTVKYRIDDTIDNINKVMALKAKHPKELMFYRAHTTGKIIFGGTFSKKSSFSEDVKPLVKKEKKVQITKQCHDYKYSEASLY